MTRSRRTVWTCLLERRERRDVFRERRESELRKDGRCENHVRADCALELIEERSLDGVERPRRAF